MDPRMDAPLNSDPAAFSRAGRHRHRRGRAGGAAAGRSPRAERGPRSATGGLPGLPHFAPKAKRVIYLFQSGGPSQLDLFDYKPQLAKTHGTDLPDSIRKGQRLTGDDRGADELSRSRRRSSSSRSTGSRAPGSASCCRTPPRSPTTCASSSRCTPSRSITIRR